MPGLINRVPQGLLSLLDLKAQGENAKQLGGELQTVIDTSDLYIGSIRRSQSSTITPAGVGLNLFTALTVPAGFVWVVTHATVFNAGVLPAAATNAFVCGYQPADTAQFVGLGDLGQSVTGERGVSTYSGRIFALQPGDTLAAFVTRSTGAPGDLRCVIAFASLTV